MASFEEQLAAERNQSARLRTENERLFSLVTAKQNRAPSHMGYLFKHRPYATGLFSNSWELRFFTLSGSALQYYKSEQDATQHPRGHIDVTGCVVEWEGRKRDYWTFSVINRSGMSLVRVSTSASTDAQSWVDALVEVGCERRLLSDAFRVRSPLRAADVRWDSSKSKAFQPSPERNLEHRWQDSDSEASRADEFSQNSEQTAAEQPSISGKARQAQHLDYTSDTAQSKPRNMPRAHKPSRQDKGSMTGATVLHTESRPSMLSADRIAFTQHSGILNLMMLVIVCANARLIMENLLKYGILANPAHWVVFFVPDGNLALLMCWPALAILALCALGIERLGAAWLKVERRASMAKRKKDMRPADARKRGARMARQGEGIMWLLNAANTTAVITLPAFTIRRTHAEPVPAFFLMLITIVLWMKLISFWHCNLTMRHEHRTQEMLKVAVEGEAIELRPMHSLKEALTMDQVHYPDNLSMRNLAYFLVVPTLVYQTSYPQSSRFRARWVLWYFVRALAILGLLLVIVEQYLVPTIANSLVPVRQLNWAFIAERILKLSLPTLYGWVFLFYVLFHLWLNVVAELTMFGDREFYKDWWNATTIGDYWRLWNMPVHKWMLRHVYYPALRRGVPRLPAMMLVFFVSAVFHELLVGWPLHMVKGWAFGGVMAQVPLVFTTEYLKARAKSDQVGNFIFWISFCIIGQPICLIMYYHDWVLLNRPAWIDKARAASL